MSLLRQVHDQNPLFECRSNGHGVQMFTPSSPRDFGEEFALADYTIFPESEHIARLALGSHNQALLVTGEPGSGKTHLVADLLMACAADNNAPAMSIALHIAGGSKEGANNARRYVHEFKEKTQGKKSLVIFDNIDFLGYRGKSRRLGMTKDFAQNVADLVEETVCDKSTVVIGLAHDEDWRRGRWTWQDDAINRNAYRALKVFGDETYEFLGKLTVPGLVQVAMEAGHERPEAEKFIGALAYDGLADFFHTRHVDPTEFAEDPEAAIAKAVAGRQQRKSGS